MMFDCDPPVQEESEDGRTVQLDCQVQQAWGELSSALEESLQHLQVILQDSQLQQRPLLTVQDVEVCPRLHQVPGGGQILLSTIETAG